MSGNAIKIKVHKAEEGGYWAEVEGMPGCVTEGDTMEELHKNLKEAVIGWLLAQVPSEAFVKVSKNQAKPTWLGNSRTELYSLSALAR